MHRSKLVHVLLLTALAGTAMLIVPPTHVMADIIPPIGLAPGSEYQLIFETADTTAGISSNINTYNTFVTTEAALDPSLPSAIWHAVGSTATEDAYVNATNFMVDGSYLPVYNTQGIEVSVRYRLVFGLCSLNPVLYNQYGQSDGGFDGVWTGSTANGIQLTPYRIWCLRSRRSRPHVRHQRISVLPLAEQRRRCPKPGGGGPDALRP